MVNKDWPEGYPCLGVKPYVGPSGDPNVPITVSSGTKALVRAQDGANICIQRIRDPQVCGWVPRECVEIGTGGPYGYPIFRANILRPSLEATLDEFTTQTNRFSNTVHALIAEFRAQQTELLWFLPPFFRDASESQLRGWGNDIVRGTRILGFDAVFENPDFTVMDMKQHGKALAANDTRQGIYIRHYEDFKDQPNRLPELYVGKADQFRSRNDSHRSNINSDKDPMNAHYMSARAARFWKMYPVCLIDDPNLRTLAEQLFVLMFQTNTKRLLDFNDSADITPEDQARRYGKRELANILDKLAKEVFNRIGCWRGGCHRKSFGSFEYGLNHTNPIDEKLSYEKTIWTKITVPNTLEQYRRPVLHVARYQTKQGYEQVTIDCFSYVTPQNPFMPWNLFLPIKHSPLHGTPCYMVIERMINGRPHAAPYTRLPPFGPFEGWGEDSSKIAMAIEWQEPDQTWRKTYVQLDQSIRPIDKDIPGSVMVYGDILGIERMLTRQPTVNNPKWLKDFGRCKLTNIHFDWLSQTFTFTDDVVNKAAIEAMPRRKSRSQIIQELQDLGARNVDGPYGLISGSFVAKQRSSCDRCYLMNKHSGGRWPCRRATDSRTCTNCVEYGVVCSWTDSRRLDVLPNLKAAFVPLSKHPNAVSLVIPDPGIQTFYKGTGA